jgi:hypothetical protein
VSREASLDLASHQSHHNTNQTSLTEKKLELLHRIVLLLSGGWLAKMVPFLN